MNVPKIKTENLLLFIGGALVWLSLVYFLLSLLFDIIDSIFSNTTGYWLHASQSLSLINLIFHN